MIPTTFLSVATFFFLFAPANNTIRNFIPKEKEIKTNATLSINLNIGNTQKAGRSTTETEKVNPGKPGKLSLELPPESFTESPVLLESWMSSPETWSNN